MTSTVIFFERSPFATAVVTVGDVAHLAREVAGERVDVVGQVLPDAGDALDRAWPPSLPSVPTSRATRVDLGGERAQLVDHRVDRSPSARATSPRTSTVIFFERSPCATAVVTSAMFRTWSVRLSASVFTFSVRSFQTPETPSTCAWPPSLPSVPTSLRDARHLGRERAQLVDHRVDGLLQLEHLALGVDGDLLREVAVRDRGRDGGDVAHLAGEVAGQRVHVLGQVLPDAGDALDLGLAAELARRCRPRARRASPRRRTIESWSTIVLTVFLSSSTSPLTSTVTFFERSPFATAVVTSAMFRTWPVRFDAIWLT